MADQRLLESGDLRLLESGDIRLLETVPATQGTSDTVTLTENLASDLREQFEASTGETVVLSETLRRQYQRPIPESVALSEELAVLANPLDFAIALTAEAVLGSGLHDFRVGLRSVGAPLPDFVVSLTSVQGLPDFVVSVRSLPNVKALFDLDIHRPVGRVEEE